MENVVQVETHVGEYTKLVADLKEEVGTCRYYAFLSNLGLFTHNSLVSHTSTVCRTHCPELCVILTAINKTYVFYRNVIRLFPLQLEIFNGIMGQWDQLSFIISSKIMQLSDY